MKEQIKQSIGTIKAIIDTAAEHCVDGRSTQTLESFDVDNLEALLPILEKLLKAELEGDGLVLEQGCCYLNDKNKCKKGLLINGKCPSECIYYDDGSR